MERYQTHLTDLLHRNASEAPDKLALVTETREFSWQQLDEVVSPLSRTILNLANSRRQKVVAILLPNSWQYLVSYLAILEAGHIVLPLDPSFKKLEIESITEQLVPDLVITSESYRSEFKPGLPLRMFDELAAMPVDDNGEFIRMAPDKQIATLLFTSGTTGKPKITAYSHANHLWNISAVELLWQWTAADTILLSLPLSHWHGLVMGVAGSLYHGNTVYLRERFEVEDTLGMLEKYDITLFMHVPIAYWKLVHFDKQREYDLSGVRLWVSGSSYLPPAIWQSFKRKYGVEILERYGSSETGLIASNLLDERVPGSVGYVLPGVTIESQSDGELAMDSPGRFLGYYKNPEATEKNFTAKHLWLTGDIGEIADNGRIVLKGRIQEKMKKLGYTVFPRDVEWALLKNEAIEDVFVAGIQDLNQLNDRIVYFVVGDISEAEITDYAKTNLPGAWRPDVIKLLPELPKTRSGKPKRMALVEMVD